MAKKWMAEAFAHHKGAFTRQAKAAGMTTAEFAEKHARDKGKTGRRARLVQTARKIARRLKRKRK